MPGEGLELAVELHPHARGETVEAAQEPFDALVGAAVLLEAEVIGDPGVIESELVGEIGHEAQLLLEMAPEATVHQPASPRGSSGARPSSGSSTVRSRRGSATR